LDWAILAIEKHVHFALTQWQANEDVNAYFEIIQLANAKSKEVKDGHKDLIDER
jgi:hypothetical protein